MFDLKRFRKERKLSQIDLANKIGYSQSYLSRVEKGFEAVSDKLLESIEQHFSIDLSQYKSWYTVPGTTPNPNTPDEIQYWRDKYYELLERYNGALEEKEALRAEFERKSKLVGKPLDKH